MTLLRPQRRHARGRAASRRAAARRPSAPARQLTASPRAEAASAGGGLDGGVVAATAVLAGIGMVMSYSSTAPLALDRALPPLFVDHVGAASLGVLALLLCWRTPLRAIRALALPAWTLGVALLIATAVAGVEVNGARRWLALPGLGLRFQPVELVKIATLIAVAAVVARRDGRSELSSRRAAAALAAAGVPIALLLGQPDFGNAVLLGALAALLLVAAGTRLRHLLLPAALAAVAIAAYVATHAYALRRVTGFLDPWQDAQGAGFQLVQSFAAFGKGGWVGVGLGAGRQKLDYLPEGHTDFILALIAEEAGLVGVLFVLGAFAALWVSGTRVARAAPDRFSLLLALAMTSLLTVPAVINAAVVMGLLPTKGLTLPFLSHGGTSLVACFAVIGVLLAVARHAARGSVGHSRVARLPGRGRSAGGAD